METIKLDLIPGKKMPSLHASQFDDGRAYHIDLTENRVPYVLDGTETISVIIRKCDNTLVSMDIANTFADKSYLEFEVVEQMTACSGFNYGEIILEKNGDRLGSLNFYLQVEAAPDENGITSTSEVLNLKRQVSELVAEELADNGAEETGYDNAESGLEATNVQDAIDEVNTKIENIPAVDAYTKQESDQKYATKTELSNKADISAIPTKTSQLQNNSGFAQIDDSEASASKTYSSEKVTGLLNTKADEDDFETLAGSSTLLTVTRIAKLNFVLNGTNYVTNGSYETFYVPVVAGKRYKWVSGKVSGTPYIRFVFATNIPANGVAGTFLKEQSISGETATFEYEATQNGYLSLSSYIDNVSVSVMQVSEITNGEVYLIQKGIDHLNNVIKPYSYFGYSGDKIDLTKRIVQYQHIISLIDSQGALPSDTWLGGLAVYGKYAFVYYNAGYVAVFDLDENTLVATGRASVTGYQNHGNNASFDYGASFEDLPPIYISRCRTTGTECYVEKLTLNAENGNILCELIQTITYSGALWDGNTEVDWCVDSDNRKLVMLVGGNVATFNIPSTSSPTVNLIDADIVSQSTYPTDYVRQGTCIYLGKLYILTGYANEAKLRVVDLSNGNAKTTVDLNQYVSNYEAEGICVYNNKIYVSFNNGNYGASIELYSIIPYEN